MLSILLLWKHDASVTGDGGSMNEPLRTDFIMHGAVIAEEISF